MVRLDAAGNVFIMHPWILFKILFWSAAKFVVAPLCVFALLIYVFKWTAKFVVAPLIVFALIIYIFKWLTRKNTPIQVVHVSTETTNTSVQSTKSLITLDELADPKNPTTEPCGTFLDRLNISDTELANEVYEGTRDHRRVAVGKVPFSKI